MSASFLKMAIDSEWYLRWSGNVFRIVSKLCSPKPVMPNYSINLDRWTSDSIVAVLEFQRSTLQCSLVLYTRIQFDSIQLKHLITCHVYIAGLFVFVGVFRQLSTTVMVTADVHGPSLKHGLNTWYVSSLVSSHHSCHLIRVTCNL